LPVVGLDGAEIHKHWFAGYFICSKEIVAVGKGKKDEAGKLIPLDVKVGDKVLFGKYSGQTVKVKGEELLVMREEDLMGVIE